MNGNNMAVRLVKIHEVGKFGLTVMKSPLQSMCLGSAVSSRCAGGRMGRYAWCQEKPVPLMMMSRAEEESRGVKLGGKSSTAIQETSMRVRCTGLLSLLVVYLDPPPEECFASCLVGSL